MPLLAAAADRCRSAGLAPKRRGLPGLLLARICLAVLLALPAARAAAQEPGASGLRFGGLATAQFIEGYYLNPRPLEAVDRLVTLDFDSLIAPGDEGEALQGLAVLGAFYAHIFRAQPDMAALLAGRMGPGTRPENALVAAIALETADTPASLGALEMLSRSGTLSPPELALTRQLPPFPFPRMTAESHYDVDLFWVSFFATGDTAYIDKIAEAMAYRSLPASPRDEPSDAADVTRRRQLDLIHVAAAVAAHDTLLDYGARHPLVLQELRRLAATRGDLVGAAATGLVGAIESGRPRDPR